jgi:hypothetical protein
VALRSLESITPEAVVAKTSDPSGAAARDVGSEAVVSGSQVFWLALDCRPPSYPRTPLLDDVRAWKSACPPRGLHRPRLAGVKGFHQAHWCWQVNPITGVFRGVEVTRSGDAEPHQVDDGTDPQRGAIAVSEQAFVGCQVNSVVTRVASHAVDVLCPVVPRSVRGRLWRRRFRRPRRTRTLPE